MPSMLHHYRGNLNTTWCGSEDLHVLQPNGSPGYLHLVGGMAPEEARI